MASDVPGSSSQRTPNEFILPVPEETISYERSMSNISVETGEEFSPTFLQGRAALRNAPTKPDMDQQGQLHRGNSNLNINSHSVQLQRSRSNLNKNLHLCYDLTGNRTVGLMKNGGSEFGYAVTNSPMGGSNAVGLDDYFDKKLKGIKETDECLCNNSFDDKSKCYQSISGWPALSGGVSPVYSHGYHSHCLRTTQQGVLSRPRSRKLKFLCSFGGRILPRPCDGKLRYVGGETRIISIRQNHSWHELMQKTLGICNQPHTIKYQLPGEDLDALISILSDEDLQNMIEEYHALERIDGAPRLRIFLVTINEADECSYEGRVPQLDSEYNYVFAINGALDPSPRKNSNGQSLSSPLRHNIDNLGAFHTESPRFQQSEMKDYFSPGTLARITLHPAAQFHLPTPNAISSPTQSPPFSPTPIQRKNSKNALKQFYDEQIYYGSNENCRTFLERQHDYSYAMDPNYHPHGKIAKQIHYQQSDIDTPVKRRSMHFHSRTLSRELVFHDNDLDETTFFCEDSLCKQRTSRSMNFQCDSDNLRGDIQPSWLLGTSNSNNPCNWIPYDPMIQEHGGRPRYNIQGGSTSRFGLQVVGLPSSINQSILQEGMMTPQVNTELTDSKLQVDVPIMIPTIFQLRQDSAGCSNHSPFSYANELFCDNTKDREGEQQAEKKTNKPNCRSSSHAVFHENKYENISEMDRIYLLTNQTTKGHDTKIGGTLLDTDNHSTSMLGAPVAPKNSEASGSTYKKHSQESQTDHTVPDCPNTNKMTTEDHVGRAHVQNVNRIPEPRIMRSKYG